MTATIIENDSDLHLETLKNLDFEAELPCEFVSHANTACDDTAEWILRYTCCEQTLLLCTYHKDLCVMVHQKYRLILHRRAAGGCGGRMNLKSVDRI